MTGPPEPAVFAAVHRFTCEDAFRRLDDYLDRVLDQDELRLVHEHLEICAACAREFAFEADVIFGVKAKLRRISAPPDLISRISEALARAAERGEGIPPAAG